MDGLKITGVTLFRLDAGMDSGPILAQVPIPIEESDDTASLLSKCAKAGTEAMLHYICDVDPSEWVFTQQSEGGASSAPKIEKHEGRLDWNEPSIKLYNTIRALSSSSGTYCMINSRRLRIYSAQLAEKNGTAGTVIAIEDGMPVIACGAGALKLISVQPEGGKIQNANDWLRGRRLKLGDSL